MRNNNGMIFRWNLSQFKTKRSEIVSCFLNKFFAFIISRVFLVRFHFFFSCSLKSKNLCWRVQKQILIFKEKKLLPIGFSFIWTLLICVHWQFYLFIHLEKVRNRRRRQEMEWQVKVRRNGERQEEAERKRRTKKANDWGAGRKGDQLARGES